MLRGARLGKTITCFWCRLTVNPVVHRWAQRFDEDHLVICPACKKEMSVNSMGAHE